MESSTEKLARSEIFIEIYVFLSDKFLLTLKKKWYRDRICSTALKCVFNGEN